MRKSLLMASAAMILCLNAAHAQQATSQTTGSSTTTTTQRGQLSDVVVTAARIKQNIQKVSSSVTVISSAELAKTSTATLDTIIRNVPGVELQSGFNNLYVRGIGTNSALLQTDVPISIDGVQSNVINLSTAALSDIDDVEVLRGPQGTLYGRDAAAGQVNIKTKDPALNKWEAIAGATFGNYDRHDLNLIFNVPIGDQLALRSAITENHRDGYIKNTAGATEGGTESAISARAKVLYQPFSNFKILGTFWYDFDNSNTSMGVNNLVVHQKDPWTIPVSTNTGPSSGTGTKNYNYQFDVTYDFPWATVTFTPEYSVYNIPCNLSATVTTCQPSNTQESEELRFTNAAGSPIKWTFGLYHLHIADDSSTAASTLSTKITYNASDPFYGSNLGFTNLSNFEQSQSDLPTTNKAVYGQVVVPVTDTWRVKLGGRYEQENDGESYTLYGVGLAPGVTAPVLNSSSVCENCVVQFVEPSFTSIFHNKPFTWVAGLEHDLSPTAMAYFTASTGYKEGGVTPSTYPPSTYNPEKLTSLALGEKARLFDNRFQINSEAYYYMYNGFQTNLANNQPVTVDGYTDSNAFESRTYNAGNSKLYGLEIETVTQLTPNDRLNLNLTYANGHYGQLAGTLELPVTPFNPNGSYPFNYSGKSVPENPPFTVVANYAHNFNLADGSTLTPRIDLTYKAGYNVSDEFYLHSDPFFAFVFSTDGHPLQLFQSGFLKEDAYLDWSSADSKWSVNAFVKNISDTAQIEYLTPGGQSITPPRTYGITVSYRFK